MNNLLDNSEVYWVLNRVNRKLLSMQIAKFVCFILKDDFDTLIREEFYQP